MKENFNHILNMMVLVVILGVVITIAAMIIISNKSKMHISQTNDTEVCFDRKCNPSYWEKIPPVPADFSTKKLQYQLNNIPDTPDVFTEDYWKQPEWVTSTIMEIDTFYGMLEMVVKENRQVVWCTGIYPSQRPIIINKEMLEYGEMSEEAEMLIDMGLLSMDNDNIYFNGRFWNRACPGAIRCFGVKLNVIYPTSSPMEGIYGIVGGALVNSTPEITEKYIHIESPVDEYVLGRYFPRLEYDYNKEIPYTISINRDIPKGWYIIGFEAGSPTRSFQVNQSMIYGYNYTDPNIGAMRSPSQFKVFIGVV